MNDKDLQLDADPPGWTRRVIPEANLSIATNPQWPALEQPYVFYQTFGWDNGAFSVHWGEDATMEWYLAHTGLGSIGHTRVIDEDRSVEIACMPGRRVRLRVIAHQLGHPISATSSGLPTPPFDPEIIFVAIGFTVRDAPVRVGYRLPSSERAEFEALLEQVIIGARPV